MLSLCAILIFVSWTINAENKTKRTVSRELYTYGEPSPMLIYNDNLSTKPLTFVSIPQTLKVYEQPFGVKGGTQPIPYEFQQQSPTYPTNVMLAKQPLHHNNLNQHFQQLRYQEPISSTTLYNLMPLGPVTVPLQGQNMPLQENSEPSPYYPMFPNGLQQIRRKYLQPSAKIRYNQNLNPYIHHNLNRPQINGNILSSQQSQRYHQSQQRIENPTVMDYLNVPRQNTNEEGKTSSNIYGNKDIASERKPPFYINSSQPKVPLITEGENVKKLDDNPDKQNEETDATSLEDEDSEQEERKPEFSKYSFDYDEIENDEHSAETNDDEEEDNKRYSQRYSIKNGHSKNPKTGKINNSDTNSKYVRSEGKGINKSVKKPKMMYKSVRYSKESNHSPKIDYLEGRHTEIVPVTQKHKIFKEKWYISKHTNDNDK